MRLALGLFLLSFSVQANLEGKYQLLTGPEHCPVGEIILKKNIRDSNRILMFGSQHAWSLKLQNKSAIKEKVDGGCAYTTTYEIKNNQFNIITERIFCPNNEENGVISESLEIKKGKLHYSYKLDSTASNNIQYQCSYFKINK